MVAQLYAIYRSWFDYDVGLLPTSYFKPCPHRFFSAKFQHSISGNCFGLTYGRNWIILVGLFWVRCLREAACGLGLTLVCLVFHTPSIRKPIHHDFSGCFLTGQLCFSLELVLLMAITARSF